MEAVFRLQRNASGQVREFVAGSSMDAVVTVEPTETACCSLPAAELQPGTLRLVKHWVNDTPYRLGTTLLDAERYPAGELQPQPGGGGAGVGRAPAVGSAAAGHAEPRAGARGARSPTRAAGPLLPAPLPPPQQEMEEAQARRSPDRRLNRTPSCRQSSGV